MVVPKWVSTRTQPIALDDVVRYLAGVVDQDDALGRVFEIGGPEQLTYLEMMQVAAEEVTGRRSRSSVVPVLTPRLSSYWLALVTDVDATTGRNLIDSMSTEVLVTETSIRDLVPGEPMTYQESVRRALAERAASVSRRRAAGSGEEHRQRPGDVGQDRREHAAARAPLQATHRPSRIAAKASITLPVARVATT